MERPRGQTEIERHFNYFHLQTQALLRVTCDIAVNNLNLNFTSELVATSYMYHHPFNVYYSLIATRTKHLFRTKFTIH